MSDSPIAAITVSRWLRRSGSLPCGAVVGVQTELEIDTTISKLVFLTATYSLDAPSDLPRQLVVKSPLTAAGVHEASSSESQFYRLLAPVLGTPPLVRCYATVEDGDGDGDPGTLSFTQRRKVLRKDAKRRVLTLPSLRLCARLS